MIDCARWVLAEAWLANGLRLRWSHVHVQDIRSDESWMQDDIGETRVFYRYAYSGEWEVARPSQWSARPYGEDHAPTLSTDAMKHELAHWLVSTEDERRKPNFGIESNTTTGDEAEARAVSAESVLTSVIVAASRIASMALGGKQ